MNTVKFNYRGTEINKIQFSEIESYLENKGIDVNNAFMLLADESEYVYVSNGFITGLKNNQNSENEWHHFFTKEGKDFTANKFQFN